MKRKLFLALTIVVLIVAAVVVTVNAADGDLTAYCDHCQQEVTWTAITTTGQAVTEGHFYLTKSGIVLGANTIATGKTVCINLDGKQFAANRPFTVQNGASMYVQGANGSIIARGNGTRDLGGFVDLKSGGTLYIKDTTIPYEFYTTRDTAKGGIISVAGEATLENCKISGGRATEAGGNIYVASTGKLNLVGGSITGGSIGVAGGTAETNDAAHASRCVYNDGKIVLSGSASVELLRMGEAATLDIEGAYTGTTALYVSANTTNGTVIGALAQGATITGAKLSVSNMNMTVNADGQKLVLKAGLANDNDDIHQEGFQAFCEYCQEEKTWQRLSASGDLMTNGHYYLETNMVMTGQSVTSGNTVCLNLNDNTYTGNKPLSVANGGVLHIQGGKLVARGNTVGGVVYGAIRVLSGGQLSLKDVDFTWDTVDGRNVANGGYLHISGNAIAENCTFTNGRAMEKGGNIYITSTGVLTMKGGTVTGGKIVDDTTNVARCVYSEGKIVLSGDATIEQLQIGAADVSAALSVDGAYTGELNIYYTNPPAVGSVIGEAKNGADISGATFNFINAELVAYVEGGSIATKLPPAAIVNGVYYEDVEEAVAAAGKDPLVLNRSIDRLTITKGMLVDLNGRKVGTLTVDTQEQVNVMDSKTADYTIKDGVYGKIEKIEGGLGRANVDGDVYLPIEEADGTSFHAMRMEINSVSLRAKDAAVYFKSNFLGDDMVKGIVESFGVALSINGVPDAQAVRDQVNCTVFTQEQFNGGEDVTSSLVTGVIKDTNNLRTNNRNAATDIYGIPYVKLSGDVLMMGRPQSSSLRKIVLAVEEKWDEFTMEQQDTVLDMYEQYTNVLGTWNLDTIAPAVKERAETTIRILTIGNSHGNDVNWQLRYLFQQQDPNRRVVVGFLYYSGCHISKHVTYAQNNSPEYIYYKNEYGTIVKKDNATMLDGLQDEPWDIVLLQEMNIPAGKEATFKNENINTLVKYVKDNTTSDPRIGWHMVWTNPLAMEYWNESTRPTNLPTNWVENYAADYGLNQQYMYEQMTSNVQKYVVTNPNIDPDLIFTSGTVIQYANNVLGMTDTELYRDYTHVSDFGRLMSAYLWYCKLTGETFDSIDDIAVDVVPKALRQTRFQKEDLIVTDELKEIILEAVNHTLENPYSVPAASEKDDPAADDSLNVLMIGNSFCYYYPDELVEMAKAAGKQLRICNVYYSGCSLEQHYNFKKNRKTPYDFFVRDTDGVSTKTSGMSLDACLVEGNWDVISIQNAPIRNATDAQQRVDSNKPFLDDLVGYLRTRFPNATLVWHQTWANPVGTSTSGMVTTPESQVIIAEREYEVAQIICQEYGLDRINSGDAWTTMRSTGYDNFCARLGKAVGDAPMDSGDGGHDGDIGGGQYLNACMWYEYLFGLDVRENTFVPTYDRPGTTGVGTLNKKGTGEYKLLVDQKLLQEAAHAAFAAGKAVDMTANAN